MKESCEGEPSKQETTCEAHVAVLLGWKMIAQLLGFMAPWHRNSTPHTQSQARSYLVLNLLEKAHTRNVAKTLGPSWPFKSVEPGAVLQQQTAHHTTQSQQARCLRSQTRELTTDSSNLLRHLNTPLPS